MRSVRRLTMRTNRPAWPSRSTWKTAGAASAAALAVAVTRVPRVAAGRRSLASLTLPRSRSARGRLFISQITFTGDVGEAALSPDGRTLAYTRGNRLLIQEVSGGPSIEIASESRLPGQLVRPGWSPRGDPDRLCHYRREARSVDSGSCKVRWTTSARGTSPLLCLVIRWISDGRDGAERRGHRNHQCEQRLSGWEESPKDGFAFLHDVGWDPRHDRLALRRACRRRTLVDLARHTGWSRLR